MSVTVENLLELPSMRNAEVIAGKQGLHKIVSSISVLETSNLSVYSDKYKFQNDEFLGSEIVITGFLNIADDVSLQMKNIKILAEGGEAGLILFYVGIMMKSVPKEMIEYADKMDFPIICMPKNQINLKYGEVISDVMNAVIKDQMTDSSMTISLLEQVARLPGHQQTVENMIKLLSTRLRASIILTDARLRVLNESTWPRELESLYPQLLEIKIPESFGTPVAFPSVTNGLLYRETIYANTSSKMELFIVRDSDPLESYELHQAAECVRLAICLWSQQHEFVVISELVKAILADEPLKMRYLATQLNIDIDSVHNMYIFTDAKFSTRHLQDVVEYASKVCTTAFADIYDGALVLFTSDFINNQGVELFLENMDGLMPEDVIKTVYPKLANTIDVRNAFLQNRKYLHDVKKILLHRTYYTGSDVDFAEYCRKQIDQGEISVVSALSVLNELEKKRGREDMEQTLATFLLDADQNVQTASEYLFIHKNTVKYRLKCMSEIFGFPIGRMPESNRLYIASAINRLLS